VIDLTATALRGVCDGLSKAGFARTAFGGEFASGVHDVFAAATDFFRQPLTLKRHCALGQDMGYRPIGIEYSQSPTYPDQVESFSVCARVPVNLQAAHQPLARELYAVMSRMFDRLESVAEQIAIGLANQQNGDVDTRRLSGGLRMWSRLQVNYSKPSAVTGPYVNETHEDLNLLTISTSNFPGLQVLVRDDKFDDFLDCRTGEGEVVVFGGEIGWLLSGGRVKRGYHRVVVDNCVSERLAILFFGDLDPDLCQPWIINDLNRAVDIAQRTRTNVQRFGLRGFELGSAT
jgi:isopenicillin N synthase-like dioxygenase